jgi:hypothetical protein
MNDAALTTRFYWSSRAIAGLAEAFDATIFAILPKRSQQEKASKNNVGR